MLQGVIDVDDLDRAVSLGPALSWAAAGPHLSYHLAAGDRGLRAFIQHLLASFEAAWGDMATWTQIDQEQRHRLVHAVQRTYEGEIEQIRSARDRQLAAILRAMEEARISGALAQPRTLPDSSSPGEE